MPSVAIHTILGPLPLLRGLFRWSLAVLFAVGAWHLYLWSPLPGLVAIGITPVLAIFFFFRGLNLVSRTPVSYTHLIGTGQTASDEDIRMVHTLVRELLSSLLGSNGIGIQILYGGSVKPDNAKAILSLDNVDGLLVGGASLQAQSFADIVRADLA